MNKTKVIIILVLVIIGAVLSFSLYGRSVGIEVPLFESICSIGEKFDCDIYSSMNWSKLFGLPQSILITSVYAGFLIFLIISLFLKKDMLDVFMVIPFIVSIFLLVYSGFNLIYMYILKKPPYSLPNTIIYVINIAIFIIMIIPYLKDLTDSLAGIIKNVVLNLVIPIVILGLSFVLGFVLNNIYFNNQISFDLNNPQDTQNIEDTLSDEVFDIDTEDAPNKGTGELGIEIIIFDDFQCPACFRVEPELEKLLDYYDNKIKFIFKHYPLESECFPEKISDLHELACEAAWSSEAAREQGKFWEYHKLLFSKKLEDKEVFLEYAKKLNLDIDKFNADYDSDKVKQRIAKDTEEGYKKHGLTSTPSIFFNNRYYTGRKNYTEFIKVIEYLLNKEE